MDIKSDLAFQTLSHGPISMYHNLQILAKDLEWYNTNEYKIFEFDTSLWNIELAHKELKEKMNFPDYYGENLNAFNDCLSDIYTDEYKGQIIVFHHFDEFSTKQKDFCIGLLDIIANNSWSWLLTGQRLIGIIQLDDPQFHFDKVGGNPPYWNRKEWLNANRIKR